MKDLKSLFLILSIFAFSNCNPKPDKQYAIKDFIESEYSIFNSIDTNSKYESFLELFDTIPSEFGEVILYDILNTIPFDSSEFKRRWSWEIDTITGVIAAKTNKIFDRDNLLSDETYFIIVYFTSIKNYPIAGTIYADLKGEKLGTYMVERDSINFSHIELFGDSVRINNLNDKLKIYNR